MLSSIIENFKGDLIVSVGEMTRLAATNNRDPTPNGIYGKKIILGANNLLYCVILYYAFYTMRSVLRENSKLLYIIVYMMLCNDIYMIH